MNQQNITRALYAAAGLGILSAITHAGAQITVNGSLNSKTAFYGAPLATQTIESGFGNSTVGDGSSNGGSELDAAYGNISNGTLYLFFAGNFENSGNHLNIFIADSQPNGQNTLAATVGAIQGANGLTFPAGFKPTYVVDMNDYQGTMYIDQDNLSKSTGGYLGSVVLSGGIGNNQNLGGLAVGLNNTNALGVGGNTGVAADPTAADAVTTGFEVGIPLSLLNVSAGTVQVLAAVNGGGDSYLSNQFLPGLPATYGNPGGPSGVNLQTNNSGVIPISLTVPTSVSGNWLPAGGGNWSDAVNWSNSIIPNAPGATASFASAGAASSIALNNRYTVGSISFNSAFAYTITPGTSGRLNLNNNGSNATITIFGGNHTISAPVTLNSNTTVTVSTVGDSLTISGNINGSGGFTTIGAGGALPSMILSGSNTYTGGTTVHSGNLTLGSANALPVNAALSLSAEDVPAGVLDLNGYSANLGSIVVTTSALTASTGATARIINSGITAGSSTLTYAGTPLNPSTFSGIIADNNASGGAATNLVLNSGSLTLTNSNTYAGVTTVNSGASLTLGAAGALPAGGNLNIHGGSVIAASLASKTAVTTGLLTLSSGQLDLTNNALVVRVDSLATIADRKSVV